MSKDSQGVDTEAGHGKEDGLDAHMARVDGFLLALERDISGSKDGTTGISRDQIPPPPELDEPVPHDSMTDLIRRFDLAPPEADLFRLAVASEVSSAIASTYSELQGDRRFRRPQVSFAVRVLQPDPTRRTSWLSLLQPNSNLRRNSLLELVPPWRDRVPLFSELELSVPQALLFQLAGAREVDPFHMDMLRLVSPSAALEGLMLPDPTYRLILQLTRAKCEPSNVGLGPLEARRVLVYLQGRYGTGRQSVAQVLARAWGLDLLCVDLARINEDSLLEGSFLSIVKREARRLGAAPLFLGLDRLVDRKNQDSERQVDPRWLQMLLEQFEDWDGPVLVSCERAPTASPLWYRRRLVHVELQTPGELEDRNILWKAALDGAGFSIDAEKAQRVFSQFPFSPGEMRDAVQAAVSHASLRDFRSPRLDVDDLRKGCVSQLRHSLESMSHKTRRRFEWGDLILPEGVKDQLRMLQSFVDHKEKVYDEWGVGRRVVIGRGVKGLFFGESGTGKTMAASVIASNLGIDLFKIDLSMLVSKWVGETEKNIDRVFTEAQKSHAIVLFDEADSLFGKRGSVERGTDRYSNMEINFLLQRFEEYDGAVVLTSNYPRGIDEAFSRRMHFIVEFPMPDEEMREKLWKVMLPAELPLAPDVDIERLVTRFELSGGNIQNIIVAAAFLAADKNSTVTMLDFMRATQWEYQKIGRSTTRGEFEEFFDLLP